MIIVRSMSVEWRHFFSRTYPILSQGPLFLLNIIIISNLHQTVKDNINILVAPTFSAGREAVRVSSCGVATASKMLSEASTCSHGVCKIDEFWESS